MLAATISLLKPFLSELCENKENIGIIYSVKSEYAHTIAHYSHIMYNGFISAQKPLFYEPIFWNDCHKHLENSAMQKRKTKTP